MVNKKRGVFFALFFLVVLFGLFFVSAYNQCYMKSSPTASCETGYYDDGTMCCVNMESECAPHDNNCEDGDICTTDSCVLAMQDVGYTGEDYYVCYFGDKCSGQECDPNTGTCYDSGDITYCPSDQYLGSYSGCSGSWEEPGSCSGTWCECSTDGGGMDGFEQMSFFALLTGRVVSFFGGEATITGQPTLGPICDCGGNCNDNENCAIHSCSGDTYDECTSPTDSYQYRDGGQCNWTFSETVYCSDQSYSESQCKDNIYCTPTYECYDKKDNCYDCTDDFQCLSNKCKPDLRSNNKICIADNKLCADSALQDTKCGVDFHNTTCDGNYTVACENDASMGPDSGYWDFLDYCEFGCSNGDCNECEDNTFQCNEDNLQKCVSGSWGFYSDCDGFGCSNGDCNECEDNTFQCNGDNLEKCVDGYWKLNTSCEFGCSNGDCNEPECESHESNCDGNTLQKCVDGYWTIDTTCEYKCESGACVSPVAYWVNSNSEVIGYVDLKEITPYVTVKLLINRADLLDCSSSSCILDIYNTSNGLVDTLTASVSENKILEEWNFTSEHLDKVSEDGDGNYVIYFNETGKEIQSYELVLDSTGGICGDGACESGEYYATCPEDCEAVVHCINEVMDSDETGVDCGGTDCPDCEVARYWLKGDELINEPQILDLDKLNDGDYTFKMFLQNVGSGSNLFTLMENDGFLDSDDIIFEDVEGTFDGSGNLIYNWIPTYLDFRKAEEEDSPVFFFEVQNGDSEDLEFIFQKNGEDVDFPTCNDGIRNGDEEGIDCGGSCEKYYGEDKMCPPQVCTNIVTCSSYGNEFSCNEDDCGVSGESAYCSWDSDLNKCDTIRTYSSGEIAIGQCVYDEDTSGDNCDDGFLSYDVDATWEWAEYDNGTFNTFFIESACETKNGGECMQTSDGLWHYDPELYSEECVDMSSVIPCPAQIELNFFNWKNFFAAALLILIIYIILRNSKTLKKMEEKHSKKKTSKKKGSKKVVKKKSPSKKKSVKKKSSKKKSSKKK